VRVVAIILARGGSKEIPKKNILDFCGKPLLAWTIEQCLGGKIENVFVSSDSDEILTVAEQYGAIGIKRPNSLSGDNASSESGWEHALKAIEKLAFKVDWIFAPQVTSPIRSVKDIISAVELAKSNQFDSILSVVKIEDHYIWEKKIEGSYHSITYDYNDRKRRQEIQEKFLENGSFYMFRPEILRKMNNRLGGKISFYVMEKYKMFQIDNELDFKLCEIIMSGYGLA
jgi:CMP-N,N'-diacetyllegionaminic acid synthase